MTARSYSGLGNTSAPQIDMNFWHIVGDEAAEFTGVPAAEGEGGTWRCSCWKRNAMTSSRSGNGSCHSESGGSTRTGLPLALRGRTGQPVRRLSDCLTQLPRRQLRLPAEGRRR